MRILIKIYFFLVTQLGVDLKKLFFFFRGLPAFIRDWVVFRKGYEGDVSWLPCLHDRYEEGGNTKGEYFWQDLCVARLIHQASPDKHVDVGSRLDGFVAHVASFRQVEVIDVRPITAVIPGVVFTRADLMSSESLLAIGGEGYCDSLSCLHAIEHFGLGRYGDSINPQGFRVGIENMARLVKPSGIFYLSTPIGRERVEFNANWVFDPRTILKIAQANKLQVKRLIVIRDGSRVEDAELSDVALTRLASIHYSLGLFIFEKAL